MSRIALTRFYRQIHQSARIGVGGVNPIFAMPGFSRRLFRHSLPKPIVHCLILGHLCIVQHTPAPLFNQHTPHIWLNSCSKICCEPMLDCSWPKYGWSWREWHLVGINFDPFSWCLSWKGNSTLIIGLFVKNHMNMYKQTGWVTKAWNFNRSWSQ